MLARLYIDEGHTLEDIAHRHHTSTPVVRTWLVEAGIPVKPRTAREHRKHLDPALIAELYQEREWTSAEIAAHQDTTVNQILRTLHDHDIPVRRGGPPARRPTADVIDPRLTALYADPEITALLRRHRIPRRNRPGTITERFPTAITITDTFLRARTSTSASRPRTSNNSPDNPPAKSPTTCGNTRSPSDHPAAHPGSNANTDTAETDK